MFLVPYVLFCFPGEECTWWTFHSCVQLNVLDVVSVSERSSVTRSAREKQLPDPILRSCKTQQQDLTRQAQIGSNGLKGGMNKVLVIYLQGINYILHSKHCEKLKKMLSLLSERGVPESSKNFVKFGPHRMSTGELKTMCHTNPTRILTHSHTQLLTHSHTHTLNTHTSKHLSKLRHWHTQVEGGRRRMSVREARTRLPSGFAMFRCGWLRRGGGQLGINQFHCVGRWWCFDRVGRCLLFCQPGFTMRSNLGRTVTQATRTGSRTNKIIPGLEWGQL